MPRFRPRNTTPGEKGVMDTLNGPQYEELTMHMGMKTTRGVFDSLDRALGNGMSTSTLMATVAGMQPETKRKPRDKRLDTGILMSFGPEGTTHKE